MNGTSHTPIDEFPKIRATLRATFSRHTTRPLPWRRHQLLQLARMVQDNAPALAHALVLDLGRPHMETYFAEIGVIAERAVTCADKLEEWTAPRKSTNVPDWQKTWNPTVYRESKGTVLIIGPWNYPVILSLQPLYGAIAAGCCAVIKPSEISANYSALLADLLPKYLDQSAYRVVLGGVPEVTELLELQWDHSNPQVARIIARAAAAHLTPVTLELGGKSPVIVVPGTFNGSNQEGLELAAKRILWGKISNAGQICASPDYVLFVSNPSTPNPIDTFVTALRSHHAEFFPEGPLNSPDYSRIVSQLHFDRLKGLLARTKGKIIMGGGIMDKGDPNTIKLGKGGWGMEPTVVVDVREDDVLLEREIFGPILPIVTVDSIDDAIAFVNAKEHPLFIYAFTDSEEAKQHIIKNTKSGGIVFNDTFQQLAVHDLPFGGVGDSGYGRQVLWYSYELFTYERSSVDIPRSEEDFLAVRYPPYTPTKFEFLAAPVHATIPPSSPDGSSLTTDKVKGDHI